MESKKGFTLLGFFIVISLACAMYFFYFKKNPPKTLNIIQKTIKEQGINTKNYATILESTKTQMDKANKKIEDRDKQYQDLFK